MAYTLIQSGTSLQIMKADGTLSTLTLPSGVTIDSSKRPRFAVIGRQVVLVNSPSVNLWIDPYGTVRPMVLPPPASNPSLATGGGTGLTGAYRARYSYIIRDPDTDALIAESPLSPQSAAFTATNQDIAVSNVIPSSYSGVSARRLYRTTAGGSTYFNWIDLEGNTLTTITDGLSDAALGLAASATNLGAPPGSTKGGRMRLIVSWRDRLWGVNDDSAERDWIYRSEPGYFYKWPTTSTLIAKPIGEDSIGVTGFIPRRDELGICKRNRILKVIGDTDATFSVVVVAEGVGCVAPDSIVVIDDVGYFLGVDGIYSFGPNGLENLSRDRAHGWFNTDTYFNRAEFPNAVGRYNRQLDMYELLLAGAGGSSLNRWLSYDRRRRIWWGPHKTDAFTPTFAGSIRDASEVIVPVFVGTTGGNNYLYYQDSTKVNDDATGIDWDVDSKFHHANTPDIHKMWLQPTWILAPQSAGSMTVTVKTGRLNTAAQARTVSVDLTRNRVKTRRLGEGQMLQLNLRHNTVDQTLGIYGYEIPFFEVGRR